MTKYRSYQHVERVDPHLSGFASQLIKGGCYYQPKMDGTNTVVGYDSGSIWVGKRKNVMGEGDDNRGVKNYVLKDNREKFMKFFEEYPEYVLYGEWLVPHTIRTYIPEAWNQLYVFDVVEMEEDPEGKPHIKRYVPYSEYRYWLDECGITYVPATFYLPDPNKSASEQIGALQKIAQEQTFMMQDGHHGEGIVIKNYVLHPNLPSPDYIQWGKIVTQEFKLKHKPEPKGEPGSFEEKIANEFLDTLAVTKEYLKVVESYGSEEEAVKDKKSLIPRTLDTVWKAYLEDNLMIILKKYKNPVIDFKTLRAEVMNITRTVLGW